MKTTIEEIALFFLTQNRELSRSVMTKLVYLVDYFYARQHGNQYTNIKWYYNHYGPFVEDVENSIIDNIEVSVNKYDNTNLGSFFKYSGAAPVINEEDLLVVLNHVQDIYKSSQGFNDFITYIYSTSPVRKTRQYDFIDIVKSVNEEKNELLEEAWDDTVKVYGDVLTALAQ